MTESERIINLALALVAQASKSIAAANAGDVATAKAELAAARTRYDNALAGWDAAGQPGA
jgi:hypothetical protein